MRSIISHLPFLARVPQGLEIGRSRQVSQQGVPGVALNLDPSDQLGPALTTLCDIDTDVSVGASVLEPEVLIVKPGPVLFLDR